MQNKKERNGLYKQEMGKWKFRISADVRVLVALSSAEASTQRKGDKKREQENGAREGSLKGGRKLPSTFPELPAHSPFSSLVLQIYSLLSLALHPL